MANEIIGALNTGNIPASQRFPDIDDKIYVLEATKTPLTAFLTQQGRMDGEGDYPSKAMQKETVYDPEFKEFEDQYEGVLDAVNHGAGYNETATDIVVDNSRIFNKYDIVKVIRTNEHFRVSSVVYTTHTLTVVRGFGTTAAAAILNDDELMVVSSAYEEFASKAIGNQTLKVLKSNYTEIFRTSFGISETLNASKTEPTEKPGDEFKYQTTKKGIEHAKKIERAYWFGQKYSATGPNGKPVRTTGGIIEAIETVGNVYDMSDEALTQTEFTTFLQTYAFNYGSDEKFFFCGANVVAAIENFAVDKLHLVSGDTTFGVAVRKYVTSFGVLNIVLHPFFKGEYAGYGVVLDLETVKHCVLNGRDTKLTTNIQTNGDDGREDEWKTEAGLKRVNFEKNALIKNVGTGS